jgi:hypothetical protein
MLTIGKRVKKDFDFFGKKDENLMGSITNQIYS